MAAQDHPFTFPQPARQEEHNMPPPPPPAQPQQHAAAAPAPPPPPQAQVVMGEAKGYLPTPVPTHQDKPVLEHSSIRPIAFTLFFVGIAVGVKLIVKYYGKWSGVIDPADISVVITGLFFILGQMLSNLSADFKESEKLPADIASSIEQLDDQMMLGENKVADKGVSHQRDVRPVLLHLTNSVIALMSSSASNSYACILHDLHILSLQCVLWDKKGAANLAPIPTTIDKIRRSCARARVISRTEALPVGQKLLLFFVFSTAVILWLTTYKNDASLVMTMVIIYGVTWTLAGAIRSMDDPFDQENWAPWGSMSSIDITPLTEYAERLQLELTAGVGAEVYQLPSSGAPMLPLLQPMQH